MQELHAALDRFVEGLPKQFLTAAIEMKLKKLGLSASEKAIAKAAEHIISGEVDCLTGKHSDGNSQKVQMTENDLNEVLRSLEAFTENQLRTVVVDSAEQTARDLLRRFVKNWPVEYKRQSTDMAPFLKRLEKRWGKGLNRFRILLVLCREWGQDINERKRIAKAGAISHLDDVLLRLHVRACQITSEIIVLLENGYADGAMARWRTLHEVSTVLLVIVKHGEDVAFRYSQYRIVEAKKALNAYEACYVELGYDPYDAEQAALTRKAYTQILEKYGEEFGGEYGWAAHALGKERVTFAQLEEESGQRKMRSHYRMASYNVHAGPKGVYFKLGQSETSPVMLAGASNAGLFEPAQNAALSLSKATSAIASPQANPNTGFGDIVYGKIVTNLIEQIVAELAKSQQALKRAEKRYGSTYSV